MYDDFKIGWCYICNGGWVSIMRTPDYHYFCICENCRAQWDTPEDFFEKGGRPVEDYPTQVRVTREELDRIGWSKYLYQP